MSNQTIDVSGLFRAKQRQMAELLLGGRELIQHPVEKGSASEESWRTLLRGYLPARYQVQAGFAIDCDGQASDQIDLLVVDSHYSPLLFDLGGVRYFPAESVYAAFEVKQDISKDHLDYAGDKIASVRALRRTSSPVPHAGGLFEPKAPGHIIGGLLTTGSTWSPPFGDPFADGLRALTEERGLDIGCVMQHGAFWDDQDGSHNVSTSTPSLSLVTFVFRFLARLQSVGTVPAIDYEDWLAHASVEV